MRPNSVLVSNGNSNSSPGKISDFIFFGLFYKLGAPILQTNWFIGSTLTELVFPFSLRTKIAFFKAKRPSGILICLSIIVGILTIIIPFTEIGQTVFKFTPPATRHLIWIISLVIIYFALTEIVKLFYYRFSDHKNNIEPRREKNT